jgi:hypothetical protein
VNRHVATSTRQPNRARVENRRARFRSRRHAAARTIQLRAGHRDIRSSMNYLRVFDDDERRAGDALG